MPSAINYLIAQGGALYPEERKINSMARATEMGKTWREMADYGENRNMLREKMQMEKDQLEIQKQRENREQEQYLRKQMNEPWEDLATTIAGIDMASNYLTPENHDQFVSFANNQKGTNRFLKLPTLKELEEKAMSEGVKDSDSFRGWYDQYKQKSLVSLKTQAALLKAQGEPKVVPAGGVLASPGGKPLLVNPKEAPKLTTDQLLAQKVQNGEMTLEEALEAKRKPEGPQAMVFKTQEDARSAAVKGGVPPGKFPVVKPGKGGWTYDYESPATGFAVTVDKDGNVSVMQGPGVSGITKPTQSKIEEKIINSQEQLARLENIKSEFKPEYLQIGKRLSAEWTGFKSKMGEGVTDKDRKFLTEYKAFSRTAIENINAYIKEITGAQMSEREADRIRLAQPDPGEKWYQGDDPITFQSKLDEAIKITKLSIARYSWYKNQGIDDQKIKGMVNGNTATPLKSMENIIRERYAVIQDTMKASGVPAVEIDEKAKAQLKKEFGL